MENPHVLQDIEEIVREEGIIERVLPHWKEERASRMTKTNIAGFLRASVTSNSYNTGSDNSHERWLSNTMCKDPPDFFGDIFVKMPNFAFFPAVTQNYVIFPRKIFESPDSR